MMSNNEPTSDETDTIRRSEEPTVIMTASGNAESTEEAIVYVNDLDVFVTMMLLDSSTISGFFYAKKGATLMTGNGKISIGPATVAVSPINNSELTFQLQHSEEVFDLVIETHTLDHHHAWPP